MSNRVFHDTIYMFLRGENCEKNNVYIVDLKNNKLKLLFEFVVEDTDGIINYYYEVVFNVLDSGDKLEFLGIDEILEIYEPLQYIYNFF